MHHTLYYLYIIILLFYIGTIENMKNALQLLMNHLYSCLQVIPRLPHPRGTSSVGGKPHLAVQVTHYNNCVFRVGSFVRLFINLPIYM